MSSAQVERPLKVENSEERTAPKTKSRSKENEKSHRKGNSNSAGHFPKKHKHENEGRNFKFGRKRSQSFSTGGVKFFPPYKRRKKEGTIIPPTKFLLGGNIYDPLNLNSLQDEEINRAMNAVTPKSSPIPTPRHRKGEIEVIIPPNLRDPLNLISCEDDAEYEQQLVSPTKRGRKSRNRKKKRNSSSGGSTKDDGPEVAALLENVEPAKALDDEKETAPNVVVAEPVSSGVSTQENPAKRELHLDIPSKEKEQKTRKASEDGCAAKDKVEKKWKPDPKDKIVSPVIPQPGAWKRPPQYGHRGGGNMGKGGNWHNKKGRQSQPMPNFKKKDAYFQYGNYFRYYGYRNPQHGEDVRLKFFARRKDLFQDKDVLDIGCNIGHVTLIIARDFGARNVVGLDIDRKLIGIARKNVRHYINCADSPPNNDSSGGCGKRDSKFFPISMPIVYGPVDIPGISYGQSPSASKKFPHNITFVQGNYVLDSDTLLATEQPQFDVILCLSVTKWIHLNWGDTGLKQAFKRMYLQLRPGGHLILEAQAWESYKKKKSLSETIFKNYHSIEFLPQKFTEYLLSSEVGFTKCEVIGTPYHHSKGFQRPIQLFTKGTSRTPVSWSSSRETDDAAGRSITSTPSHMIVPKPSRSPIYTAVIMSSRETDDDDTAGQSNTNTPSHSVVSGSSQTPVYTAAQMSTREIDDDEAAGVSSTNTPSHVIESRISKPPVYTAVSMPVRETDDDDGVTESNANTPLHGIESEMSYAGADSDTNTPSHVMEMETSEAQPGRATDDVAEETSNREIQDKLVDHIFAMETDISEDVAEENTQRDLTKVEVIDSSGNKDIQQVTTLKKDEGNVNFDKTPYESTEDNTSNGKTLKSDNLAVDSVGSVSDSAFGTLEKEKVASSDITQAESDVYENIAKDSSANIHLNVSVEKTVPENARRNDKITEQVIKIDAEKEKLHNEDGDVNIKSDYTSSNET